MKETINRPRQVTPESIVAGLLALVRGQFCGGMEDKEWFQHSHFVRRNVILWPARFMVGKGFTLPPDRYESILQSVFMEVKHHGQTGDVRFWPGYLMKCVQDHWRHHWEEYYQESKSARSISETALVAIKKVAHEDRTVDALAIAHRVLSKRGRKSRAATRKQLSLFVH